MPAGAPGQPAKSEKNGTVSSASSAPEPGAGAWKGTRAALMASRIASSPKATSRCASWPSMTL